jgi:hypothetical protein
MATQSSTTRSTEAAALARMIHPERDDLPGDMAQALLRFQLDRQDLERMHELAVRNQDDALTPAERDELEGYLRLSLMVDLMHAKAQLSLQKHH